MRVAIPKQAEGSSKLSSMLLQTQLRNMMQIRWRMHTISARPKRSSALMQLRKPNDECIFYFINSIYMGQYTTLYMCHCVVAFVFSLVVQSESLLWNLSDVSTFLHNL